MEFSVKKFDLLDELSLTQGVVERKTTIPILSNLLFEVQASRLTITATDLELSIRTSCEAKVKKEGGGTIPAKKLLELVRLLPDEEIRFKLLENHWVQVTCDRKNYKLVGMSKDNFPALPSFPQALVKIPAKLLADVITKTTFAISLEESRYTIKLHETAAFQSLLNDQEATATGNLFLRQPLVDNSSLLISVFREKFVALPLECDRAHRRLQRIVRSRFDHYSNCCETGSICSFCNLSGQSRSAA